MEWKVNSTEAGLIIGITLVVAIFSWFDSELVGLQNMTSVAFTTLTTAIVAYTFTRLRRKAAS
ncbi:hypothetical protein [Halorussus aquaticus]|uniref:Uncharacterized protein n=1 Tax=Halorussus aquaticus TaxID=2953748 RepID=A0ABD5Q787_9EURY|nr:hypothetical protein [Halorussus aquaticus]